MKESEIQFENYDYIMFVDASGDDGFQFRDNPGDGSSSTFVSSCFVVRPIDIKHNGFDFQRFQSCQICFNTDS